ncbi:PTS sugar transporter subunit IIA [Streptococcus oriscaviae]|uniref:PTS fructose transporter subunit IIA n=1 Tax=Streptococcus oriscaviae TaxID=2781599 RepID=A0ABX7YI48_9STRE|nr:PTS fructose transporter subunit IIA [Streptococcus oriscaviae]QUE53456.1 PTS fructose transporter subunit IIA [Streptococcus oriscaviae]
MNYLMLISHGGLAEGLKSTLAMFAGDKVNQVLAFGLKEGQSVDAFAEEVRASLERLDDAEFILLADIVGGSPLATTCNVLAELGKLEGTRILGGMNLTMALTTAVMMDTLDGEALVATVLSEATTALQEFKVASSDDEDDDI